MWAWNLGCVLEPGEPGSDSPLFYINMWAMVWPNDYPALAAWNVHGNKTDPVWTCLGWAALVSPCTKPQDTIVCAEIRYLFMAGGCIKDAPSPTILFYVPCCHVRRIGQDRPGRLKLGSLVLPPALCKTHARALKSVANFGCSGAPKLTPLPNYCYAAISWRMRSMCHKPAQFVGNGRLFNLFFGSGRTGHWLLRYGSFKLGV